MKIKLFFLLFLFNPFAADAQLLDLFNKIKEALPAPGLGILGNSANVNALPSSELERIQSRVFEYPKPLVSKAILTKYGDQGFQCQSIPVPQSQPSLILSCFRRDNYGATLGFKFSISDPEPRTTTVRLETNAEFFVERITLSHFKALEEHLIALSKENFVPLTAGSPPPASSFLNSDQKNIESRRFGYPEDKVKTAIYDYFINDRKCMPHAGGYRCFRKGFIFGETDRTQKPISYIFEFQSSNDFTDVRLRIFDGDLREDHDDVYAAIQQRISGRK